jgi:hypothetical protein
LTYNWDGQIKEDEKNNGEMKAYKTVVEKSVRSKPLRRPACRGEDNVLVDLQWSEDMDWINLACKG